MKIFKPIIYLIFPLFLSACASFADQGLNKENTVGRDVDEVIQIVRARGFSCGKDKDKDKDKEFITSRSIGGVLCSIKEPSLICPNTYKVYVGYELDTNKVIAFGRRTMANCF